MPHVEIAVIGAGFSGIATAVRLLQEGRSDFVVFERAPRVGGVWRDNTYPGCACDVPAHLYALSFAPNPDWTNTYAGQGEILGYLESVVERFGIQSHLRLSHAVRDADWDAAAKLWRISTNRGDFTANTLVFGAGALSEPLVPEIPGIASFQGRAFHSARWNASADLRGKRVAVIGTGASAIQIVPSVQPQVEHLTVFQRTPPWVMPRRARTIGPRERAMLRRVPFAQRARRWGLYWARELLAFLFLHPRLALLVQRMAAHHLTRAIRDPQKRKSATPGYILGCKRIVVSDDYYSALDRDNVTLETRAIESITPTGIRLRDGTTYELDVIVFATGFRVLNTPIFEHIRGRDGVALSEAWSSGAAAYLGTTTTGFPNFFMLQGPNTGLGHTSVVIMIEEQINHMMQALHHLDAHGFATIEPTVAAQEHFIDEVQAGLAGSVWNNGGCRSWYLDTNGHNSTLWPGTTRAFARRLRAFEPRDYRMERM